MATDFYSVLGVPKGADAASIKKAYRKLARDLHPDKNPGNKAMESRFKDVNRAYEVLGDDAKRKLYDEFGEDALREGFDADKARAYKQWQSRAGNGATGGVRGAGGFGGGVNLEDLFSGAVPGGSAGGGDDPFADLFGRASRRRGPVKGRDYEQELTIDFNSAVRGTSLQLRNPSSPEPVTVRIPPGADEGSRVRIKEQGAASPSGGPNGDLILVIHVEPHPLFTRDGDDLTLEVPITVSEAIKGARVHVPTFDGDVTVKVPPGTQSGTKLRVRGKGVHRKGRDPGDLYVRFMVHVPTDGPELMKLADELAKYEPKDVRAGLHI
ncbi:MAG: Chaperone protein DnaJ [Labilithrix sp.]|nr:Chaperone protein DnaJ [Labilithrix sp.]